jgi:trehalose/maltose hydrolase-like predicted phosphorylase
MHITVDTESVSNARSLIYNLSFAADRLPNTIALDSGIPPRGLHGEAYRG